MSNVVPRRPSGMPSDIISDTSPAVIPGASLAVPGVSAIGPYERFYQLWPSQL